MDRNPPLLTARELHGERGETPPSRSGLALGAAVALCRVQSIAHRTLECSHAFCARLLLSGQRFSGALFSDALRGEEKSQLTVRIYDFYPGYKSVGDTLYRWEQVWFERRMPKPPARVLVGASGTGREAIALAVAGYRVVAFEPAPEFVEESKRRLRGRAPVMRLSYEQLSALVLDGVEIAGIGETGGELRDARFDAVILGCGSLTHVLDIHEQRRLLRALHLLCPTGPIFASFFCEDESSPRPASEGRAARFGRSIGRAIARRRGISLSSSDRLGYRAHSGFAYTFTKREIEELARIVDRRVAWEDGEMRAPNYATFLAAGAGT